MERINFAINKGKEEREKDIHKVLRRKAKFLCQFYKWNEKKRAEIEQSGVAGCGYGRGFLLYENNNHIHEIMRWKWMTIINDKCYELSLVLLTVVDIVASCTWKVFRRYIANFALLIGAPTTI